MPAKRTILRDLRDDLKVQARIWAKINRGTDAECWPWIGASRNGYGHLRIDERTISSHRVVWELIRGPIPTGMDVLHRCDNPPCCNPSHLFLGTHTDNMRDRSAKGRRRPTIGEANPKARLTADDVLKIRARWRAGERPAESIAADYPVTKENVYAIVFYRSWKHVP